MSTNQMWAGEGSLGRAASMVAEARVDFDRLAAVLTAEIAGHQSRWQGSGGSAFFAVQQAWTDKQRTIVAALNGFEQALLGTQAAQHRHGRGRPGPAARHPRPPERHRAHEHPTACTSTTAPSTGSPRTCVAASARSTPGSTGSRASSARCGASGAARRATRTPSPRRRGTGPSSRCSRSWPQTSVAVARVQRRLRADGPGRGVRLPALTVPTARHRPRQRLRGRPPGRPRAPGRGAGGRPGARPGARPRPASTQRPRIGDCGWSPRPAPASHDDLGLAAQGVGDGRAAEPGPRDRRGARAVRRPRRGDGRGRRRATCRAGTPPAARRGRAASAPCWSRSASWRSWSRTPHAVLVDAATGLTVVMALVTVVGAAAPGGRARRDRAASRTPRSTSTDWPATQRPRTGSSWR